MMGWDSSRPVPWQRLVREWLVYAAIMIMPERFQSGDFLVYLLKIFQWG